jgi:tetratricopeptide (TPR) repeat protein
MGIRQWQAGLLLAAAVVAGCRDNKENNGVPRHADQIVNPEDRRFEESKDPPVNATTHFAAGQLAESQGNLPAALEQYAAAIKLDPKHESAVFRSAVVLSRLGQHGRAIQTWKRYIELTHNSATGYSNLGYACELAGQRGEAETAYRRGIDLDPKNQACRVNYGLMLARSGRTDEAMEQLSVVLSPAQVHYNLASVLESMGQKDRARLEYRKSLELDPGLRAARTRLAAIE